MAEVFRINKTKNYTVMSNYHLQDKNLSYRAKGLLSCMLSLPDDWNYSVRGLASISKEGIKAINSMLKELEENYYLKRERKQENNGRFYYEYIIYETPYTQKGITDKGATLDGTQINTNIINNNNKDKIDKAFNPITNELIKRNFIEEYDLELYKYDDLFIELLNEYEYKDVIKVCNYIIDKWKDNKGFDEDNNKIDNKFSYFKSAMINNLIKINQEIDFDWE